MNESDFISTVDNLVLVNKCKKCTVKFQDLHLLFVVPYWKVGEEAADPTEQARPDTDLNLGIYLLGHLMWIKMVVKFQNMNLYQNILYINVQEVSHFESSNRKNTLFKSHILFHNAYGNSF
jgi:hypothetical protein